jgi:DNA-binding transcriptional ArsR family regulator
MVETFRLTPVDPPRGGAVGGASPGTRASAACHQRRPRPAEDRASPSPTDLVGFLSDGPADVAMELVLWQALAGTRGGPNRARILRAVNEHPQNANQLADEFDLAYNTVRHHLEVLEENSIVESSDADYGTVYVPSERARNNWDTVEEIITQIDE